MLKKIIVIAFFGLLLSSAQAQFIFDKGDINVNTGLGFISMDGNSPSIFMSGDLGLVPTGEVGLLSIGGLMEYKYSTISNGNYYNQVTVGPRAAWHMRLPFFEKLQFDLYTGIGAGIHHYREFNTINSNFDRQLKPYFEYFLGGKIKLNSDLSLFAEGGGGGISSIKAGFVYHFNASNKKSVMFPGDKNRYYLIKK